MAISHKKKFGVYHWDTFDNETTLIDEVDTIEKAEAIISKRYGYRKSGSGADKVEIVDSEGSIVSSYSIC